MLTTLVFMWPMSFLIGRCRLIIRWTRFVMLRWRLIGTQCLYWGWH
jgi:hypothetical protein